MMDLYFMDNGAVYMTNASAPKGKEPEFSAGALSGLWIGSADDISMRIGDQTYKAHITEDGYLAVYMTKALPMLFRKTDCTEIMSDLLKNE